MDGIPEETLTKVQALLESLCLSQEKLQDVSARLSEDLLRGLGKHTHRTAAVKMLPTFVTATPNGTEKGDFLALDLGGTNLRVFHICVMEEEKRVQIMDKKKICIDKKMMLESGDKLFRYIADFMGDFLVTRNLNGQTVPLGFTFSFPCVQTEIGNSVLKYWTKGFKCSGVEGEDVVMLLKKAISSRKDYDISTVAMVNDTTGTMINCAYTDPSCEIGLIIGTGTNACYMEEMRNVKRVEGEAGLMCINTEWGGFGDDGSLSDILTEFDDTVDKTSVNPGKNIFEKMISGMYLGEIVRLMLVKMTREKLLFQGKLSEKLLTPGSFETKFISEIEETDGGLQKAWTILTELGLQNSKVDALVVRLVCDIVSSRSARLCAAALATLANRIRLNRGQEQLKVTVAVDGTVFRKHPNYSQKLRETVHELAPQCDITFSVSEEGSGKGAALVTAMAQRLVLQSKLLKDSEEEQDK